MGSPVFGDGDAYFILDVELAKEEHLFLDCDYINKSKRRAFPYMFYASGSVTRQLPSHKGIGTNFYKLYLRDLEKVFYYFTVSKGDPDCEWGEDMVVRIRYNQGDMIEGIIEILDEYPLGKMEYCHVASSKKTYLQDLTKQALESITKQYRELN